MLPKSLFWDNSCFINQENNILFTSEGNESRGCSKSVERNNVGFRSSFCIFIFSLNTESMTGFIFFFFESLTFCGKLIGGKKRKPSIKISLGKSSSAESLLQHPLLVVLPFFEGVKWRVLRSWNWEANFNCRSDICGILRWLFHLMCGTTEAEFRWGNKDPPSPGKAGQTDRQTEIPALEGLDGKMGGVRKGRRVSLCTERNWLFKREKAFAALS